MPTATQSRQLKATLGDLLRSLEDGEKSASIKPAQLRKKADEPDTTHPVGSADDGTQPYPEGSHASELTTRIKEDQPLGVGQAKPNDAGSQNDVQIDMGLTSKTTGTDPAVEQDVKDRPEDPGTSSDVDTSVGEKYSAQRKQLDQLVKVSEETGSTFLAILNKIAGHEPPAAAPKVNGEKVAEKTCDPTKEAVAGYELAATLSSLPTQDKQAMLGGIQQVLANEITQAINMATKTAEYIYGVRAGVKQAEGEPPPEEGKPEGDGGGPPAHGEGGGDTPPDGGGGDSGLSEEDLIQLLMQGDQMPSPGGDAGGGGAPGGGGGIEALLAGAGGGGGAPGMGGGDPGMGGGLPPEMGGGGGGDPSMGGGGAGGGQIDPQMLEAILQEIGANPEQLEKAMAAKYAAAQTKQAAANRSKFGPKYDHVKKAVADLLGRRVA